MVPVQLTVLGAPLYYLHKLKITYSDKNPGEAVDRLYDEIQEIIDRTPKCDQLFIMGDFNARIGNLNSTYPSCSGKHTIGVHNDQGSSR